MSPVQFADSCTVLVSPRGGCAGRGGARAGRLAGMQAEPRLYERVAAHVAGLIEVGALRPGDRVPSVRRLSKQQQCAKRQFKHHNQFNRYLSWALPAAGQGARDGQAGDNCDKGKQRERVQVTLEEPVRRNKHAVGQQHRASVPQREAERPSARHAPPTA